MLCPISAIIIVIIAAVVYSYSYIIHVYFLDFYYLTIDISQLILSHLVLETAFHHGKSMMHLYVALKATTSHLPVLLTVSIKQQDMLPWIPVKMIIHYLLFIVVSIK